MFPCPFAQLYGCRSYFSSEASARTHGYTRHGSDEKLRTLQDKLTRSREEISQLGTAISEKNNLISALQIQILQKDNMIRQYSALLNQASIIPITGPPPDVRTCKHCETDLYESARFCHFCGAFWYTASKHHDYEAGKVVKRQQPVSKEWLQQYEEFISIYADICRSKIGFQKTASQSNFEVFIAGAWDNVFYSLRMFIAFCIKEEGEERIREIFWTPLFWLNQSAIRAYGSYLAKIGLAMTTVTSHFSMLKRITRMVGKRARWASRLQSEFTSAVTLLSVMETDMVNRALPTLQRQRQGYNRLSRGEHLLAEEYAFILQACMCFVLEGAKAVKGVESGKPIYVSAFTLFSRKKKENFLCGSNLYNDSLVYLAKWTTNSDNPTTDRRYRLRAKLLY